MNKTNKKTQTIIAAILLTAEIGFFVWLWMNQSMLIGKTVVLPDICGMGVSFQTDGFRLLYGAITTFMWTATMLFSVEYMAHYANKGRYYFFTVATYLATMGVFFAGDLFTVFIFFEIMSFTSYVWVAQDERKESLKAAATYLAVAVIGGMVMLMGLFLLYHMAGTLSFVELKGVGERFAGSSGLYVAGACMLFGFGAKAGAFPLHIWLPKAHPVAPAPASALLSGVLTKTGVFGILILTSRIFFGDVFWGTLILVLGVITMAGGAVLALFSVDLKRTLACSSMSQIGFILVGVGMQGLLAEENLLAVWGSVLHMANHSLIKLVLFMAAGVVFMNLHQLDLNEIRGFGRKKPLLKFIFLMGALGIAGVPLWNGYVSKTLLHEAIVEYYHLLAAGEVTKVILSAGAIKAVEWIFLISGGLTVAYMLKLFIAVFAEENEDAKKQADFDNQKSYMNGASSLVLTVSAVLLPVMGIFPGKVMQSMAVLAQEFMGNTSPAHTIAYFSLVNLKGAAISLGVGVLVYFFIVRKWMMKDQRYVNRWPEKLDLENALYRPLLLTVLPVVLGTICRILDRLVDGIVVLLRKTLYKDSPLPHELQEGNVLTHVLGQFLDGCIHELNGTLWIYHKKEENMEHKISMVYDELSENNSLIGRSLSFGLMLSCLGLVFVLLYILIQYEM